MNLQNYIYSLLIKQVEWNRKTLVKKIEVPEMILLMKP